MRVCVCAHALVSACVDVLGLVCVGAQSNACVCARVSLLIQHKASRHTAICFSLSAPYFSTSSYKDSLERIVLNPSFDFFYKFYLKYFSVYEEFSEMLS